MGGSAKRADILRRSQLMRYALINFHTLCMMFPARTGCFAKAKPKLNLEFIHLIVRLQNETNWNLGRHATASVVVVMSQPVPGYFWLDLP